MRLVIVESPTKARTIGQFLGKDYKVESSFGHIRDLPKDRLAVDTEHNFEPEYIVPLKARKNVKLLKEAAEKAKQVVLATDEDREGESIAWHIVKVLGLDEVKSSKSKVKSYERIAFHEITKEAVEEALKHPRGIDINLVNAQQARRVLDRLVGYKLSPFLWKKIARGLSAGRVQSVAVRFVVEREREIEKFVAQEYWSIVASLLKLKVKPARIATRSVAGGSEKLKVNGFEAVLAKKDGQALDKLAIKNKEGADKIVKDLEGVQYKVASIEKKEVKRNPLPPFTTSTLQQEAWKRFKFPAKMTMGLAQALYESGLITYHRTDSLNLSAMSVSGAKKFITENYGQNYWPGFARKFKTKSKGAQEAHEAIRPTYPANTADIVKEKTGLDARQAKLYDLIWRRFTASQMSQACFDATSVEIEAGDYTFRASGQTLKFDGFLRVYPLKFEETELPSLEEGEILRLKELVSSQHFTQPPARYTEASLIKALEENGLGRPSTYAPIISTVQERNYIAKNEKKQFQPTEIGLAVNDLLVEHFPKIVDVKFTANMEEELDEIAEGKDEWVSTVREFYEPFMKNLNEKYKVIEKKVMETKEICEKCSKPMVIRMGRYGQFMACSGFPACKNTKTLPARSLGLKCPECQEGDVVEKRTGKGKVFWGCSRYPECKYATWQKPQNG